MTRWDRHVPSVVLSAALMVCAAWAGEAAKDEAKKPEAAPAKPATHKVARGPFRIEAELKGILEARRMTEVILRPEVWAQLTVRKAAEHGARVKKGDVVLALDTTKIDEAIQDAEAGLRLMEPAITVAEEEVAALEKSLPLDLATAERASRIADEDLKRYLETDRPLNVRSTHFAVKTQADYLEYQKEELRQLEKMYKADDLTEETEEIILKRQRDAVERTAFALEKTKIAADRTLNVEIPRQDVTIKENAQRQGIALAKAKIEMPLALKRKRLELEKLKSDHEKAVDKLAKLKKDREAMTARAPHDGIVYYGPCIRGNWPALNQTLEENAPVKPNAAVLTIVEPQGLFVRATVPENQLERVEAGIEGRAIPVGYPGLKLRAKVESVSPVPVSPGSFEATLSVVLPKDAARLVAGMNCTLKLVAYSKKDALTVPASAVFTDDGQEAVVYVHKDGGHEKRVVSVGRTSEKEAEILKGLKEGEIILTEEPKDAK